jgi:hypothetical protein
MYMYMYIYVAAAAAAAAPQPHRNSTAVPYSRLMAHMPPSLRHDARTLSE